MKITVIIPCYNRVNSIARAIESVLNQTLAAHEIIVVDDGSSDGSDRAVMDFGDKVTLISQENSGAAPARNRAIEMAKGQWIAFLDSDDVWHPQKLEKQARASEICPNAGLVFCDTCTVRSDAVITVSRFAQGGLRENAKVVGDSLFQCDRKFYSLMLRESRVITSAVMVRRDLPSLVFPEDIWGSEDWALWLSLILDTAFVAVDEVLVTMEAANDNLTQGKWQGRLHRNDVLVLESFLRDPRLTDEERNTTQNALRERRGVAIYSSLFRGENLEARELLKENTHCGLSRYKCFQYRVLSYLPSSILRFLGRSRVSM